MSFLQPPFWARHSANGREVHFALKLVTAPTSEPLTLVLAKAWLRVDITDDDALISGLIQAARVQVEQDTSLLLVSQTWDVLFDAWPDGDISLALGPLVSVTSITTTDLEGASAVLAAANYQVDNGSMPPRICRVSGGVWTTGLRWKQPIAIRGVFGYPDGAVFDVTSITQAAGVATVTTPADHALLTGALVTVSGATPSAYNGMQEITVTGVRTFTFALAAATASPATGTITALAQTIPANLLLAIRLKLMEFYEGSRGADAKSVETCRMVYDSVIRRYLVERVA